MVKRILSGRIETGCGDAKNWEISEIQKITGCRNLKKGTLNLKLAIPHNLRPDCKLPRGERKDGRDEDLYFEYCFLVIGSCRVPALIARTSTNHWKSSVLEIMAEEMLRERYCLKDGDTVDVEVSMEGCGGPPNSATT